MSKIGSAECAEIDIDLKDVIIKDHGPSLFQAARWLGVEHEDILDRWEARIGEVAPLCPVEGMLITVTPEAAANAAHWDIVERCQSAYFSNMTREDAEAVIRALPGDAVIHLAKDLRFISLGFASTWNRMHPDEEPIGVPGKGLPPI